MVLVSLASQQHWPCARPCLPRMPLSSLWVWPRPGLEGAGGSQSTLPTLPIHWDFQGTIVVWGVWGQPRPPGAAPGPASSPSDPRGAPSVRPAWCTPPSSHWSTCQVRHTQQGLYKCLLRNGGPDPVTQPPGLSVPICGTEHKHQAGSTPGARGRARSLILRRARCGNVATRSQARGRRARGGGKPRRRRPSWEDRPPAPSLPGGSPSPCASRVGQLCEQTPHHHGTQGVRWAEVGQAGPSSPGCGWREWGPPEWATWLGPSDGGAHPLPGSPFIMSCN